MKWIALITLFMTSPLLAYTNPSDFPDWDSKTHEQKIHELERVMWMEQDRFDRLVIACMQTFDNTGRNYNDQWRHELQDKSILCANELMEKIDINLGVHKTSENKQR